MLTLFLRLRQNQRWAIEMKRSLSDPKTNQGLLYRLLDVKSQPSNCRYPGQETYRVPRPKDDNALWTGSHQIFTTVGDPMNSR